MITRIYVHNFRCFENFALDLADRPSALVIGKNGSGKSTLRQAFRVFQRICRGPNRVGEWIKRGDFAQYRERLPMRFELDAVLGDKRYRYAVAFEMPEDFREPRVAEESLSVDGASVFTRRLSQVELSDGVTFGLDWHVAALPVIQDRRFKTELQTFKTYCSSMILIAPIPQRMSGFSDDETLELDEDAGNVSAWLKALLRRKPAAYGLIDEYLRGVMPDFRDFEFVEKGGGGDDLVVTFEAPSGDEFGTRAWFTVRLDRLSDGEKCFLLSASIVALSKLSKVAEPVFCFWDEPDNHLSLAEVGHFITRLRKIVHDHGQFIATSHHPETIRKFSDESTIVLTRASHLEPTVARSLADVGYEGDLVLSILLGEIAE